MYKRIGISVACLVLIMTSLAFAGSWGKDSNGWYYLNDDGTYTTSGWQWIDGNNDGTAECYYFDNAGYLLTNTTVEGYQVNSDGAWIVAGNVKAKNIAADGINVSSVSGNTNKDEWKKAYIDFIESGKYYTYGDRLLSYEEYFTYRSDSMFWDFAYINDDEIPELMLNRIEGDTGWVYSYVNGNIVVKEGGQNTSVCYKRRGNLIYSTQDTRSYQNFSYRIGADGFQLIHSTMSYARDENDNTVDDIEVTHEQYNAAMDQYFNEPDMVYPEYKYTNAEIIEIIKNL